MMDSVEKYQYHGLNGSDAIRLIKLHPSTDLEAQVRCELLHTSLTECEDDVINTYTAISYVWGDPNDTRTVLVDEKTLEITATLDTALRHIRSRDGVARLWADAICINQADIAERTQQVRHMGPIYACAAHTIIFFPSSTPEAELFLDALRISNGNVRKGFSKSVIAMGTCNELWTLASHEFLGQVWFTRVWVLQELLFSRSPWIQCGSARCRWDDFYKHVQSAPEPFIAKSSHLDLVVRKDDIGHPLDDILSSQLDPREQASKEQIPSKAFQILLWMSRLRTKFYSQLNYMYGDWLLLELLQSRRALGATDPRDIVFAHVLIARSVDVVGKYRDLIQADYSKDCSQVYEEVARYLFENQSDFSIFSLAEDVELGKRRPGMASWAPDWTVPLPGPPWTTIPEYLGTAGLYFVQDAYNINHVRRKWSVPRQATHGWLGSTFVCVGAKASPVNTMSAEISLPFRGFNIAQFFKDRQIDDKTYEELWSKVDQELGPGILPPLCCAFDTRLSNPLDSLKNATLSSQRHAAFRTNIAKSLEIYTARFLPSTGSDLYTGQGYRSAKTDPIIALLVYDTLDPEPTSVLQGRRLTSLLDGRPALVPASTRAGDIVVCLAGSTIPYVLRPRSVQEIIPQSAVQGAFAPDEIPPDKHQLDCRRCQYFKACLNITLMFCFC
ncbi:HET-domain-containing protein [Hyaloscypha bicolor E]|uniref:HET-domain-containing protein n=1 Tax=Hyaloscypha bicolor E TaxID=1095630 RepID=A0A2J6TE44_9HELO|nr:HET-domain-containing protein [Hyaloscypha bicolor E]PMD61290.1 HET-domain-containing protein [Hyaloscypha bicolor E]